MTAELKIELLVPAEWPRVEAVRQAAELAVRSVTQFAPEELATSLSIVAGELMENAVKYGRADRPVSFLMRRESDRILVSVTNDVDSEHASPETLRSRVEWLATFESPLAAYHASIAGLDTEGAVGGAGLGLARIMHEGECRLRCDVGVDGRVTLEAWRLWPEECDTGGSPAGSTGSGREPNADTDTGAGAAPL